ncbi:hypothetical protein L1887_56992 [Cichorium endivia]|nr:hypothetical protein L1887_56992 [Cichorium endivia]
MVGADKGFPELRVDGDASVKGVAGTDEDEVGDEEEEHLLDGEVRYGEDVERGGLVDVPGSATEGVDVGAPQIHCWSHDGEGKGEEAGADGHVADKVDGAPEQKSEGQGGPPGDHAKVVRVGVWYGESEAEEEWHDERDEGGSGKTATTAAVGRRCEVEVGQMPSCKEGAPEGGDEALDDKEEVLFDGDVADGEPDAVAVVGPGAVFDDDVVPGRCP